MTLFTLADRVALALLAVLVIALILTQTFLALGLSIKP